MRISYSNQLAANFDLYIIIALVVVALIAVVLVGFLIISRKKKSKTKDQIIATNLSDFYLALGGKENVVSHNLNGTRLTLVLKDYKLVDREKLREYGVERVLSMTNKYILVGQHLEELNKSLD